MMDAVLYNKSNLMPKRDVLLLLQEFGTKIKWKQTGARIIDIGSGDGSVTVDILTNCIPSNYKKIVGCDINKEMLKFSTENYSRDNIEFKLLNIEGELPGSMRYNFDHVVSFYALHWIRDQEKAFTNIYELLADDGGCWLLIVGHMVLYDIWRKLSRMDRWRHWLKDVERYVGAYHDTPEPTKEIEQLMKKIGFTNIEVIKRPTIFTYDINIFRMLMTSMNLFKIPKELIDNYLDDMVNNLRCMSKANNKGSDNLIFHYDLLIVSGNK